MGIIRPQETQEEYHKICGEILSLSLNLELVLNFLLANYFSTPQDHKTFILGDFFVEISFNKRIELFKEICRREQEYKNPIFNKDESRKILGLLDEVRKIRNRIAHHSSIYDLEQGIIKLTKGKSIIKEDDNITINKELAEKVKEQVNLAIKGVLAIHNKINEKLREK